MIPVRNIRTRRLIATVASLAGCLLLPAAAMAQGAGQKKGDAAGSVRSIAVADLLPWYDRYIALPAAGRDGFTLQYSVRPRSGSTLPDFTVQAGTRQLPVRLSPEGEILNVPELHAARGAQVQVRGPAASLSMEVVPVVAMARRIPVAAVQNALDDFDAARRSSGVAALAIPRMRGLSFGGVSSGAAVTADGRRIPLPLSRAGRPEFRPGERAMQGAVALEFATPPRTAEFAR
jgi:hypothetical protein